MDKILEQLVAQSPGLAAMLIVVIAFLKALGHRDKMIRSIYEDGNAQREAMLKVLQENTVSATRNTVALDNVSNMLEKCGACTILDKTAQK